MSLPCTKRNWKRTATHLFQSFRNLITESTLLSLTMLISGQGVGMCSMFFFFFLQWNLLEVWQARGPKRGCDRDGVTVLAKTTSNRQRFLRVDWYQMDETSNLCLPGQAKAALCLLTSWQKHCRRHRHYYWIMSQHQPGSPSGQEISGPFLWIEVSSFKGKSFIACPQHKSIANWYSQNAHVNWK